MLPSQFPVIDLPATGANIRRLRQSRGLSVRDLQRFFGFEEPQAIYKWQRGQSLPLIFCILGRDGHGGISKPLRPLSAGSGRAGASWEAGPARTRRLVIICGSRRTKF